MSLETNRLSMLFRRSHTSSGILNQDNCKVETGCVAFGHFFHIRGFKKTKKRNILFFILQLKQKKKVGR